MLWRTGRLLEVMMLVVTTPAEVSRTFMRVLWGEGWRGRWWRRRWRRRRPRGRLR